jgi:hypothetical protein
MFAEDRSDSVSLLVLPYQGVTCEIRKEKPISQELGAISTTV